jgi:hypothetical protein
MMAALEFRSLGVTFDGGWWMVNGGWRRLLDSIN